MSDRPLIQGTSISVRGIAALASAMSVEDILEDYPSLTRRQVEDAIAATPLTAKDASYPNRSLKRALSDLVSLGVFDDVPRAPDEDLNDEAFGPMAEFQVVNG